MKADSGGSYPSGHATTAAVLAAALFVIAATYAARNAALVLGGLYALAVAASRVYLAGHYPLDVIGGMLCALAAAYMVTGAASPSHVTAPRPRQPPRAAGGHVSSTLRRARPPGPRGPRSRPGPGR